MNGAYSAVHWFVFSLMVLIAIGFCVAWHLCSSNIANNYLQMSLPVLCISGVSVLILILSTISIIFSRLGLANPTEAMGLPSGSIRAVIALSLIILYIILAIYLYDGIRQGSQNVFENATQDEVYQILKGQASLKDFQSTISRDANHQPIQNKEGKTLYNLIFHTENISGNDLAKQILVLLGTLMTAVASFYLGANTATTAATASQSIPQPNLTDNDPKSHSVRTNGRTIRLKIIGNNLNIITQVKIQNGDRILFAKDVSSSAACVSCTIEVDDNHNGTWDIVVSDGVSRTAMLPAALRILA